MAVNSFNPRLFSSSSTENDVDDVFRHKGGAAVAPMAENLPTAKNRCFSEPVYQNGKEIKMDESKVFALNDSSNVLRRQFGRVASFPGAENPFDVGMKKECIPILEETSQIISPVNSDSGRSTISDTVFPEPESCRRRASNDAYRYSVIDEVESRDAVMPNVGRGQETDGLETLNELDDVQMTGDEQEVYYMRDGTFGATEQDVLLSDHQQHEEDEDDCYPDKEYFPSSYGTYSADDLPYVSYPWDTPTTILKSYDLDSELEIPDDLIQDTELYPDLEKPFGNLSPATVPTFFSSPVDY